jgi:PHD/YefM family antitoxin component YafN of YafNO toxin-antitoxin module
MPSGRFVGAAELQQNSTTLLEDIISSGETCFITENGRARAVLMDIHRYNCLMDVIEEAESFKNHHPGDETKKHVSVRAILQRNSTARFPRSKRK